MFLTSQAFALAPNPLKFDEIITITDERGDKKRVKIWVEHAEEADIVHVEEIPPLSLKLKIFMKKVGGYALNAFSFAWIFQIFFQIYWIPYLFIFKSLQLAVSSLLIWTGINMIVYLALLWIEKRMRN